MSQTTNLISRDFSAWADRVPQDSSLLECCAVYGPVRRLPELHMKLCHFGGNALASCNIARIPRHYHSRYHSILHQSALDFDQKISISLGPVYPAQGTVDIQGELCHS